MTFSWYIFGRLSIGKASFSVGLLSGWLVKKVWRQCHNNLLTKNNLTLKKTPISPILKSLTLSWCQNPDKNNCRRFHAPKLLMSQLYHKKETKGSQKYLFNRQKKNAQKHHYLLSFVSSAPSCWFSRIKLPLLELKSLIIILKNLSFSLSWDLHFLSRFELQFWHRVEDYKRENK